MKKYLLLLAILVFVSVSTHAVSKAEAKSNWPKKQYSKPTPKPIPAPIPVPMGETRFTAYITAYASGDNDPAGTTTTYISGIGGNAGGTGTYANPITMAVGYIGEKPDYAAGTIFYIPNLQRYFKVGDTCAACHKGSGSKAWLDVYAGNYSGSGVIKCEESITGNYTVIQNPVSNYKVTQGSIYNGISCSQQFGNTI